VWNFGFWEGSDRCLARPLQIDAVRVCDAQNAHSNCTLDGVGRTVLERGRILGGGEEESPSVSLRQASCVVHRTIEHDGGGSKVELWARAVIAEETDARG
jgi:deoxycytidylate deaminase